MVDRNKKHPDNAPGSYYVDENCIGCYLCAELAPAVFDRVDDADASFEAFIVKCQPKTDAEDARCRMALGGCPSDSIGRDG